MGLIQLTGLGKRYPGATTWSLVDVNLGVPRGEVYGLVGENGAGKTTLLRLLLGLIRPSAGRVGLERGARLAYVPDRPAFWPTLRVGEHLAAVGRASGLFGARLASAVVRVLALTELESKARARIGSLSRGMLQRLGIGAACLAEPDLIVLDEPAAGLDPAGQKGIRDLVQALHRQGKTVLLSSHYLVELERVCTRVGVLHQGRLVLDRPLEDLVREHRQEVEVELEAGWETIDAELAALGLDYTREGQRLSCRNLDDERYFALLGILERRRLRVLSLRHPGLLERIFLDVAGGGRR